ncbi:MAG: hypothetical protein O7B30_02350, partial [Thaumarchaeota archaeon]|nr:hypothetical protein [Nitrososphaerota archaeon]
MRIDESVRNSIIKGILSGLKERPVAEQNHVSKTGAHKVYESFINRILEQIDDKELREIFENLVKVAIEVRRKGLSLEQARVGVQLNGLARSLGLDPDDLLPICASLESFCRERNIAVVDLLQSSGTILQLEKERKVSYADAPAWLDEAEQKIRRQEEKLKLLKTEVEIREKQIRELPQKRRTTQRNIDQWNVMKSPLEQLGIDTENMDETIVFLKNIVDSDNDTKKAISRLRGIDSLRSEKETLVNEKKRERKELSEMRLEKTKIVSEILRNKPIYNELLKAEEDGIPYEFFREVRRQIESAGDKHQMSFEDSSNKFLDNLRQQYDPILGFSKT